MAEYCVAEKMHMDQLYTTCFAYEGPSNRPAGNTVTCCQQSLRKLIENCEEKYWKQTKNLI